MAVENESKLLISVIFLCILWYCTSSANNIVGKTLLNEFPYPMTVSMAQLLSITIYSGPMFKLMGIKQRTKFDISLTYYRKYVIPLSLGKFIAVLFSHISLWRVPVSYAHTIKATMPLFTVILSRTLFKEVHSFKIYFSLVPIIVGVAIASITEISFDYFGLVAALSSTAIFAILNIFSKKVLTDTGMHHLRLLHLLGKLALIFLLPFWIFSEFIALINDESLLTRRAPLITTSLLALDGGLNWFQNMIAFSILSRITTLSYSVANATKRIAVISSSLLILANPVTVTNVFGMFLATAGVLGYNKAKYDENQAAKKALLLPISQMTSSKTKLPETPNLSNGLTNGPSFKLLSNYFPNPLQVAPYDVPYGFLNYKPKPELSLITNSNMDAPLHSKSARDFRINRHV